LATEVRVVIPEVCRDGIGCGDPEEVRGVQIRVEEG
jgi:hypothetical protein